MFNVSQDYKDQINNAIRNPSYLRVKFGLISPDQVADTTITDNGGVVYSDSSDLTNDTPISYTYDTLELHKFLLDTSHQLATESYGAYQGYVSSAISDENCVFQAQPKIIGQYGSLYDFVGLTLRFDEVRNDFVAQFKVECFDGETSVYEKIFVINTSYIVLDESFPLHDRFELTFLKSSLPFKRVRLHYLGFGLTKTFDDSILINTKETKSVDLLSSVLPKGDFEFTFLDINSEYQPDNPDGIYSQLEALQPVKYEYGYELESGIIEWISGGTNYTTGEVGVDSSGKIPKVTFKTNNALAYLSDVYRKGLYSSVGVSLYDLAVELLSGTNLQYDLDASLQSIYTNAPLPVLPIRECLQLIANAGQCILDVDRSGTITMTKLNVLEVPTDFRFTFENMITVPSVSKLPPLKRIVSAYYDYAEGTVSETISEVQLDVATPTEFYLEHDPATETSLVVDGTLVISGTPEYYTEGCIVTLNGIGKVTITGKKLVIKENGVNKQVNSDGEDCDVRNQLITDADTIFGYMTWSAEMLAFKNEYSFENRGFPELDMADLVSLQTLYADNLQVVVVNNEIDYSGAISSKAKVIFTNRFVNDNFLTYDGENFLTADGEQFGVVPE